MQPTNFKNGGRDAEGLSLSKGSSSVSPTLKANIKLTLSPLDGRSGVRGEGATLDRVDGTETSTNS